MSSPAYRAANRERLNAKQKAYYAANREARREYERAYYAANRDVALAKQKARLDADPAKRLIQHARRRARELGLPFEIEKEHIIVPDTCPVLGIPLFIGARHQGDNSPSLDRFVPELGYVPGNIAVISSLANRIKTNATAEQVAAVARWMLEVSRAD